MLVTPIANLHQFLIIPEVPIRFSHQVSIEEPLTNSNKNIMMTHEHYVVTLEWKMKRKKQQLKSRMFKRSRYWCLNVQEWQKEGLEGGEIGLVGGKNNFKIFFNELWNFKWCRKVGDTLHSTIKVNLPLSIIAYHVPFCGFAPIWCKYNMKLTITKHKAWCEGQDMLYVLPWLNLTRCT